MCAMHACIHSFIHSLVHSFVHLCTHSFICTFTQSFICLFIACLPTRGDADVTRQRFSIALTSGGSEDLWVAAPCTCNETGISGTISSALSQCEPGKVKIPALGLLHPRSPTQGEECTCRTRRSWGLAGGRNSFHTGKKKERGGQLNGS